MVLFERPEASAEALEWMTGRAEDLLQRLGLAYRVLLMATREMGFVQAKKYDLEVWAPGVERWLEVSSCSNFRDYQARRMAIRYRPEPGAKPELVHTLNGSGLALARVVAAILETYQRPDGSVTVPEVLRPYIGRDPLLFGGCPGGGGPVTQGGSEEETPNPARGARPPGGSRPGGPPPSPPPPPPTMEGPPRQREPAPGATAGGFGECFPLLPSPPQRHRRRGRRGRGGGGGSVAGGRGGWGEPGPRRHRLPLIVTASALGVAYSPYPYTTGGGPPRGAAPPAWPRYRTGRGVRYRLAGPPPGYPASGSPGPPSIPAYTGTFTTNPKGGAAPDLPAGPGLENKDGRAPPPAPRHAPVASPPAGRQSGRLRRP